MRYSLTRVTPTALNGEERHAQSELTKTPLRPNVSTFSLDDTVRQSVVENRSVTCTHKWLTVFGEKGTSLLSTTKLPCGGQKPVKK